MPPTEGDIAVQVDRDVAVSRIERQHFQTRGESFADEQFVAAIPKTNPLKLLFAACAFTGMRGGNVLWIEAAPVNGGQHRFVVEIARLGTIDNENLTLWGGN